MTETSIERARQIVADDHVAIFDIGPIHVSAMVKDGRYLYKTTIWDSGDFSCTCPRSDHRSGLVILCVHAVAIKLAAVRTSMI